MFWTDNIVKTETHLMSIAVFAYMFIVFEPLKVTVDVFVPLLSTLGKSCCS